MAETEKGALRTKKKILVVDDDLDTVEILRIKLEGAGYEVVTARDGEECISKCQAEEPDLLLIDVMMPKMSGFKVVKLLKGDKRFADKPMVILTARTQEADRKTVADVGANGYMTKPFDLTEVVRFVKKLME